MEDYDFSKLSLNQMAEEIDGQTDKCNQMHSEYLEEKKKLSSYHTILRNKAANEYQNFMAKIELERIENDH